MCSPDAIGGEEAGDHRKYFTIYSKQYLLKMKPQELQEMVWSYSMKAASPCISLGKFQIQPVLAGIPGGTPSSHEHKDSFRRGILHMPRLETTSIN